MPFNIGRIDENWLVSYRKKVLDPFNDGYISASSLSKLKKISCWQNDGYVSVVKRMHIYINGSIYEL